MCGIAGFSRFNHSMGGVSELKAMGEAIAHRGPDASGEYLDDFIGLSHRRLSIIDLSAAGNQPMFSHDRRYVIAFNGEIYNFLELRETLVEEGYPFQTHTDTEVILGLYDKLGTEGMLEQLNGMFAFALWDIGRQELVLARDRMGKKPLYYLDHEGQFAFASEIKSILTLDGVPRDIRDDAVYDFFAYQYVPDPKTIFTHIHKLPPAHYMRINASGREIKQYWEIDFSRVAADGEEALKQQLHQVLESATKRRMVSDVPLGAFLSGGVDSSGVVAMMANQSEQPVKTCSIGFDEERFNETDFAQVVADQYHTEHHELTVHQNVADNLEQIVAYFDEPFADPSLVPTYFVSQLARSEVTVAVAGDGGDEVFAGYEKYTTDDVENRLRQRFPSFLRKSVFPVAADILAKIPLRFCQRGKSLLSSLSVDPAMGFYITNAQIEDRQWEQLAKPDFKQRLGSYHPAHITLDAYQAANGEDHLAKILYTDMKTYLTGGILVKVDRMSMANSLEVRAPILDKEVVEFAATVPSALKYHQGEKKYLLKETFKPLLPDDILYRKKMGFSVPLANWLRGEIKNIAERYIIHQAAGLNRYFEEQQIRKLWDEHQQGRDHSAILWSMLMFEMWFSRYIEREWR